MRPSKVRELARRYANDELSFHEYRIQRRRLIDLIVEDAEPRCETTPRLIDLLRRLRGTLGRQKLVAAACAVVLTLIVWSIWPATSSKQEDAAAAPRQAGASGARLIKAFLQHSDWDRASLTDLQARWQALSVAQRRATRHTLWYRRLDAELEDRINQQQALAPLDASGVARSRAVRLTRLAKALTQ